MGMKIIKLDFGADMLSRLIGMAGERGVSPEELIVEWVEKKRPDDAAA